MTREELLKNIRNRLEDAYSDRLKEVVLYGSEARGEAVEDSDLDFLVILEGPVNYGRELWTIIETLYPLQLEIIDSQEGYGGRLLHAYPVAVSDFEAGKFSLYRNARAEGRSL